MASNTELYPHDYVLLEPSQEITQALLESGSELETIELGTFDLTAADDIVERLAQDDAYPEYNGRFEVAYTDHSQVGDEWVPVVYLREIQE
jgi:hypothetical protein